jgi:hypothetical protein
MVKRMSTSDLRVASDAGIFTVEGQVSGARAAQLNKQREQEREKYEALKRTIKEQNATSVGRFESSRQV